MSRKKSEKRVAVIDLETDPFKYGRVPRPFAAAFYDGVEYCDFWGINCVERLAEKIATLDDDYYIFAHNGGKFDFMYLIELGLLENPVKIINGRIVTAKMGRHELRDSYAILPIPLKAYQKDEIDYANFEAGVRDKYRADILHYLSKDCEYLFELVSAFVKRFGIRLTIGGTAMKELKKLHPFESQKKRHDEQFRQYYFGGRVQCFNHGVHTGAWKIYDINSSYPNSMKNFRHPIGSAYITTKNCTPFDIAPDGTFKRFPTKPYFIHFTGDNKGALPVRTKLGLDFNQTHGEFFACSHEIKIALKHGLIKIHKVHAVITPFQTISFDEYVEIYMADKVAAKLDGDKAREIFAKLLLNSAYGKFGQNPDNYYDFVFRYIDQEIPTTYEKIHSVKEFDIWQHKTKLTTTLFFQYINDPIPTDYELYADYSGVEVWRKPAPSENYYDVAVAASITSASRAVLLDALQSAKRPMYCDTDSIICEELNGVPLHPTDLGAWDLEGEGDQLAIAGKKLYCLKNGNDVVKLASKGVHLSGDEIFNIANGGEFHYYHDAPNFKLSGDVKFIDRKVRATK